MTSARTCVFCGGKDLTREHVWPRWLGKVMAAGPGAHVVFSDEAGPTRAPYEAPAFTTTARVVCGSCNSGWMHRLEDCARPMITPMVLGDRRCLDAWTQGVLGTWALKTAMMLQSSDPSNRAIPPEHYHSLYVSRIPPPSVQIGLAAIRESRVIARFGNHHLTQPPVRGRPDVLLPHDARFYAFTLQVGSLVIQGSGHTVPGAMFVVDHGRFPGFLQRIWPAHGEVTWPPAAVLDDASMENFQRAFRPEEDPETLFTLREHLAEAGFDGYSGSDV